MHHANTVRSVVAGLQEVLHQDQATTKTLKTLVEPIEHVENLVQTTQQQLVSQMQLMQTIFQDIHLQYAAAPQPTHRDYGDRGYYRG